MGTVLRFHPDSAVPRQRSRELVQIFIGFWLLGLINNAAYVIMIAGANEIASSAVGLVYFCAIGPTILVKLTAPYWFHLVKYSVRFWVAALLMAASFCIVALSSSTTAQLFGVALVAVQGGLGEASALGLCSLHPNQLSLTAWSSGTGFAGILGYAWVAVLHYWLKLSYTITLLIATAMPGLWLVVFHGLMRLSSKHGSSSSSSSSTAKLVNYRAVPSAAEDEGLQALLRPESSLSSSSGSRRGTIGSSSSSRVTSPELELSSSPASSAPESEPQQTAQTLQQLLQPQQPQFQHDNTDHHNHSQLLQQHHHYQQQQQQQPGARWRSNQASPQPQHQDGQITLHVSTRGSRGAATATCWPVTVDADGTAGGTASPSCYGLRGEEGHVLDPQRMTALQRLKATCALWPYMVPLFVVYFAEYAMQSGTWTAVGFPVTSAEARQLFYLYSNWLYQAGVCISRSSGMLFQANRIVLWIMPVLQCFLLLFFGLDAVLHVWWNWWLLCLCFIAGLLGGAVYVNSFTLMSLEIQPALKEFSLSAACVADSIGIACADLTAIFIQGCLFKLQGLTGAAFKCGVL